MPPAKRKAAGRKKKLTAKQLAQRRYAGKMKSVRARAHKTKRGKGKIKNRTTATTLRRKLGLKKKR